MANMILFRNCQVYSRQQCKPADVLIGDGVILEVAPGIDHPAADVVELSGRVLSPGFVDIHVHLREPGFSQKETIQTGTRAAAAGGFTTVCAMPNLSPVPDSRAHLDAQLSLLQSGALVEVLPYGAITKGEAGQELADLAAMAPDCIGFSDDGKGVQSAAMMEEAMRRIAELDRLLSAHCEDESLLVPGGCVHEGAPARRFGLPGISSASEWKPIMRDLALVAKTGVRYHVCHISAKESVALIRKAKAEGLPVTCECTPHQLALCGEDITEDSGRFKMNPPLRDRADREAIIEGLLDGTIDCIATDHAPHTAAEKSRGLSGSAFGIVGLETAFAVCHTALVKAGHCDLPFLLSKMTDAPARIIRREAAIEKGQPASFAVLDPEAVWRVTPAEFYTKGRSTPFDGMTLTGRVDMTWHRGEKVFARGEMQA